MIRGKIVSFGTDEGKESVEIIVRAASKFGAVMASRGAAAPVIPFRKQQVIQVQNLDDMRIFDQWRVVVRDNKEMKNIGR